jgi:protein FAM50
METNSRPASGASTPRFMSQSTTAEDLLKNQTVGLVALSDFRKRRADALEAKEREAQDKAYGRFRPSTSGTATPDAGDSDG